LKVYVDYGKAERPTLLVERDRRWGSLTLDVSLEAHSDTPRSRAELTRAIAEWMDLFPDRVEVQEKTGNRRFSILLRGVDVREVSDRVNRGNLASVG
jgi:hypothetical protein